MRTIRRLAPIALIGLLAVSVSATRAHAQARTAPAFQPAATPAPAVVLGSYNAPALATPVALDAAAVESGFATSGFGQFMASPAGRVLRIAAGVGMIAGGIAMDSNGGNALAIAGAIPLSAGLFDVCWLSPIFGGPLKGADIRAAKK
jgi:hypothetical protein